MKTAWLSFDDINNESVFSLDDFHGAYCIGGVDLSITTDLTAANLPFMKPGDSKKYMTEMFWLPADRLQERVKQDKFLMTDSLNGGLFVFAPGTPSIIPMLQRGLKNLFRNTACSRRGFIMTAIPSAIS